MTIDYFFIKNLSIKLGQKKKVFFVNQFDQICAELASLSRVLCHRDYHSRNIMIKDSDPVIIDFQDARFGIRQYDLVSLLEDCYYELFDENVDKLKKYYWENTKKSGDIQSSFEKFCYYYDLMAIQRTFKAIGSFSYIYHQRKDKRYLKYISHSMEKLKRFLLKYEKFHHLKQQIFEIYYAN